MNLSTRIAAAVSLIALMGAPALAAEEDATAEAAVTLAGTASVPAEGPEAETDGANPTPGESPAGNGALPALPDPISKSAAVYATFQADVSDVSDGALASAADIETSLTNLGSQNPEQLSGGWLAYAALIASQDEAYRAAVRDIASYYGEESFTRGLRNDPRYARTLDGGKTAVTSALVATDADVDRINTAGAYVKEQAYSLQAYGWAKARIGNTDQLIETIRTAALAGRSAAPEFVSALGTADMSGVLKRAGSEGAVSLWDSVSTAANAVRVPALPIKYEGRETRIRAGKEPIADRIATLAAYRILGDGAASPDELYTAMSERQTKGCLKMAQLNLHQCVAAAHKQYEVPFCIGEHALLDVGSCLGDVTQ